jgi:uncharacterized membrane protein
MEDVSQQQMNEGPPVARVRRIDMNAPKAWLRQGLGDFLDKPVPSLFYGLVFVVMGYALAGLFENAAHMVLALAAGFMLVGPFLATGLYDLSRQREIHGKVSLGHSLVAWKSNPLHIGVFALLLALVLAFWVRIAALIFAVVFAGEMVPEVTSSIGGIFTSGAGLRFLLVFVVVGGAMAWLVFCCSVVAVPMLLDQKVDTLTAINTSVQAVLKNLRPLFVWAVMVAGLTFLGLITLFIGLIVTMPVIGHATWHAYRSLVEDAADSG